MKSILLNRKWISLTTAITFLIVGVTGVFMALHIATKGLSFLHEWIGYALMLAAAIHLLINWKAFTCYFRTRSSMILALLGTTIVVAVICIAGNGVKPQKSHPLLQTFDINANGVIDTEETALAEASLKKLDVNRDGVISAEEFKADHGKH